MITPSESMAMLSLIRHAIVRHSLEQYNHSQPIRSSRDYLKLLEINHGLLSEKKTATITKHIGKSSEELLANLDKSLGHSCPNDLLTASISLYETMRTINFAFKLH